MRLTEPGLYVSRDGRVAVVENRIDSAYGVFVTDTRFNIGSWVPMGCSETEGDWQRIDLDAIKWPDLPPRPKLVLATHKYNLDVSWYALGPDGRFTACDNAQRSMPMWMTVVHHDDNDPEAVAMINAAKEVAK